MSDEPDPREQPAPREDAVGPDDGADAADTDLETPETDDVAPDELAHYCLHALGAAGSLLSEDAVHRLADVTLAGMRVRPAEA